MTQAQAEALAELRREKRIDAEASHHERRERIRYRIPQWRVDLRDEAVKYADGLIARLDRKKP